MILVSAGHNASYSFQLYNLPILLVFLVDSAFVLSASLRLVLRGHVSPQSCSGAFPGLPLRTFFPLCESDFPHALDKAAKGVLQTGWTKSNKR
jgi:hypothetical protein